MTALFEDLIFGPINSRRLGISLGVNLLPRRAKICNFDCIYCECGSNEERAGEAPQRRFADAMSVAQQLRAKLTQMVEEGTPPNVITFAGNGEPTLHPEFESIIAEVVKIRDEVASSAKISLLSNATTLHREGVLRAMQRLDNNILKLDSAINTTARIINRPAPTYDVGQIISQMSQLGESCIVQTMFLRGEVGGTKFDNTTEEELTAWLAAIARIQPRSVMIYTIDRDTPCQGLVKMSKEELEAIGERVRERGIECSVA